MQVIIMLLCQPGQAGTKMGKLILTAGFCSESLVGLAIQLTNVRRMIFRAFFPAMTDLSLQEPCRRLPGKRSSPLKPKNLRLSGNDRVDAQMAG